LRPGREADSQEAEVFKAIVVGTDGSSRSRQAVRTAGELAREHDATLHIVRAYRPVLQAVAVPTDAMMALAPATDAEVHDQVETELGQLSAELTRDGVVVQTYCCAQAPAAAILDVAMQQSADLIVVGSKGMQGARRVLGSVPNTIAHKAECTVMIVPTV
jgi:nucleotide-binding universal stress UspA family protein